MRIQFIRAELYESEGRGKGPSFAKGEIVDARPDFGERWLRRGSVDQIPGGKDVPEGKLFVRVKGEEKQAAQALADELHAGGGDDKDVKADRVERRGAKWFAMAGGDKIGKGMDLEAAKAFASANALEVPTAAAERAAQSGEGVGTLPDGSPRPPAV